MSSWNCKFFDLFSSHFQAPLVEPILRIKWALLAWVEPPLDDQASEFVLLDRTNSSKSIVLALDLLLARNANSRIFRYQEWACTFKEGKQILENEHYSANFIYLERSEIRRVRAHCHKLWATRHISSHCTSTEVEWLESRRAVLSCSFLIKMIKILECQGEVAYCVMSVDESILGKN